MHVRKDVVIVAVVRGTDTREWNTASIITVKICDNRIALRLRKF